MRGPSRPSLAWRALVLSGLLLALGCERAPEPSERPPARETPPPSEEVPDDLAARLAARLLAGDPHADVERLDESTVRVGARTADVAALDVLCVSTPDRCDDALDAWAERLLAPVDPATEESLSAILLPTVEVEAARTAALAAGLPDPVVGRPWVGPFTLALVVVLPDVLRQLEPSDLEVLGGRDEAALEPIALANLASLPPFRSEPASAEEAPEVRMIVTSDGLATSRLLLVERWRAIATAVSGRLLAAVPTTSTILYTGDGSALDVATLAYLARRIHAGQAGPVSPAILRLGEAGWELESENDRPDPERDRALEAVYGATPP